MSGQHRAPDALSPGQETGTYGIRGCMGTGAGLEVLEYGFLPLSGFETPDPPVRRLVAIPTTLSWLLLNDLLEIQVSCLLLINQKHYDCR
jgi:hypothetical protein